MKESTVFIRILGEAGSGKTTIANHIGRALKESGIETEIWDNDNSAVDLSAIKRNLKAMGPNVRVIIQTEQVKKHIV